jgi:gluconate 2-dehydrogenase subunit 3-like protein
MSDGKVMKPPARSRRSFLLAGAPALTGAWLAANWPTIVAAAEHSHSSAEAAPENFTFLRPAEVADVDAITAQLVPSGKTPGAREAHATHFIDHSLTTIFAWRAASFRTGLTQFQTGFHSAHPGAGAFAHASSEAQVAYLKSVEDTEFFATTRLLTLLGMFSSPKYGGNFNEVGWKMLGFVDEHVFSPPFGYYDAQYTGFVPYAPEKHT